MKKTLAMLFITLCCISGDCGEKEYKPDPILLTLRDRVEQECKKLGLKPRVKFSMSNMGDSLVVRYKPRTYIIHPRAKDGKISEKTVKQEGPSDDGFILKAYIQPLGTINQAKLPQTILTTYWFLYLNVYKIEKEKKQIYFALSYNSHTNPELLNKMEIIGEEISSQKGVE